MLTLTCACNQMGVMLAARRYEFQSAEPFKTSDILDLQSVVKHLSPVCEDARDLLENGKLCLAQVSFKTVEYIFLLNFDPFLSLYVCSSSAPLSIYILAGKPAIYSLYDMLTNFILYSSCLIVVSQSFDPRSLVLRAYCFVMNVLNLYASLHANLILNAILQGKLNEAYEAFSEAFTILQQVRF